MSSELCDQEARHHRQGQTIVERKNREGSEEGAADTEQRAGACGAHDATSDANDTYKEQHGKISGAANTEEHGVHGDGAIWPPGYYYQDSGGNTQGPCSLQDLQALHECFPEAVHMTIWAGDGSGGGFSAQLDEILRWEAPKQQRQDSWAHRAASAPFPYGSATANTGVQPAPCAYAEAVLAGLPEDDEAVQLARLAKASGNSLESVLHFQHTALSCKSAEESAAQDSDPYQDVRSWCPPEQWEAFIADRQKRKDLGQPPRDWKKLKRHRQDVKAKQSAMSMEWLRK